MGTKASGGANGWKVPISDRLTFTVGEASRLTGLSSSTIWRAIYSRQLYALRVGGRRLIEPAALEIFLHAQARGE
jgi:excisionase family DNA binding protein